MKKLDRIRELEKIAEKLGIGQNREVKCVACKRKIQFKDAVILTNKKKVTYLCKKCYKKLEAGELNKKQIETNEILKELEKLRKKPTIPPFPKPEPLPQPKPIPWNPYEPGKWGTTDIKYTGIDPALGKDRLSFKVFETKIIPEGTMLLKFEPNYDNKTSSNT